MAEVRENGRSFDDHAEVFRTLLGIARATDAAAAVATSSSASVLSCARAELGIDELGSLLEKTSTSVPSPEQATEADARALFDAPDAAFDAAFDEMVGAVTAASPEWYRAKHRADLETLFEPVRRRAHGDTARPTAEQPTVATSANVVDAGQVALAYGSALFPALGVVVAAARSAVSLAEGRPWEAAALAVTMVPEGTPARALAELAVRVVRESGAG